jgi:hypothetical protein
MLDPQAHKAMLALLDRKASKVFKGFKVTLAQQAQQVRRASKVRSDLLDPKAYKVWWVLLVQRALKASKATQVLRVQQGRKAFKV